ncbi:hypothetical protein QKW52_18080 [Bacillus sonorensis]|nr:hypothetical protein [Bacillus sonorensis]
MSTDSRFDTRAEQLTKHARFFEYTTASDPIGSGSISPVLRLKNSGRNCTGQGYADDSIGHLKRA